METCGFPNCNSAAASGFYCPGHARMMGSTKPPADTKPIPNESDKQKDRLKEYKAVKKAWLKKPENKVCKINGSNCTHIATAPHHTQGRQGEKLNDTSTWIPSCDPCNLEVEIKDAEAREAGHKKTRLGKITKKTM